MWKPVAQPTISATRVQFFPCKLKGQTKSLSRQSQKSWGTQKCCDVRKLHNIWSGDKARKLEQLRNVVTLENCITFGLEQVPPLAFIGKSGVFYNK